MNNALSNLGPSLESAPAIWCSTLTLFRCPRRRFPGDPESKIPHKYESITVNVLAQPVLYQGGWLHARSSGASIPVVKGELRARRHIFARKECDPGQSHVRVTCVPPCSRVSGQLSRYLGTVVYAQGCLCMVPNKTFCIVRLGEQEWLRNRPTFPTCFASIANSSVSITPPTPYRWLDPSPVSAYAPTQDTRSWGARGGAGEHRPPPR